MLTLWGAFLAVMEHLESETPGIFGTKGGNSRGHSLSNGSFNLGQFIGPLLSGSLADNLGYDSMTSTLCKFHSKVIAAIKR